MDDPETLRRWVNTWKEAGPQLDAIRRQEIRSADNLAVLAALEEAFNQALQLPLRPSSGMVQTQYWLAKVGR